MIYELNHVGGPAGDLDASLEFYAGLGAEVVDRLFMTGSRVHRVHLQLATGLVELLHSEEPAPDATFGLDHVGFMTDELDADYARLIGLGYAELTPPRVAGSGQGRLAFLSDPNGVRIELLQRTEEFRVPPIRSGPVRRLAFIALPAPDFEAAAEFYGTHLRLNRDPSDHSVFRIGDDAVKLLESPPAATTPVNHLGLATTTARPDAHDPDGNRLTFVPSQ
ncbi:VOC family protein [Kribbella turkmenica]|uniref:VOC family protein n=1 Tax=Kribbella turkmenica TaxID=2530375 RepID=UPI0014043422|nr:VOC family protein [Kribbella turkmenica]